MTSIVWPILDRENNILRYYLHVSWHKKGLININKHSMQDDNHTHLLEHEWIFPRVFARTSRHA